MNKPDFEIGDKILCIDDRPRSKNLRGPDLVYKKEYLAKDINQCSCGSYIVDVGLNSEGDFTHCLCGQLIPGKGIHWCYSERFAKKVSDEETKKEVIEMEFTSPKEIIKLEKISAN